MRTLPEPIAELTYRSHERFLWALCYRMTGDAADADDLVQETFTRVIERPPPDHENMRPWLVRVAINLSRDAYRKRQRRTYVGPWLPSPVTEEVLPSYEPATTEGRYELLESVSFAFLFALEALKPNERAVLILRDVLDYSVRETSEALGLSEANVKTTHLRARRVMEAYDRERHPPSRSRTEEAQQMLGEFLTCLAAQDAKGLEALLAESVVTRTDGGGVYRAALRTIKGRDKVMRFYLKLAAKGGASLQVELQNLVDGPAILLRPSAPKPGDAPLMLLRAELNAEGKIADLSFVSAPRKLAALTRQTT